MRSRLRAEAGLLRICRGRFRAELWLAQFPGSRYVEHVKILIAGIARKTGVTPADRAASGKPQIYPPFCPNKRLCKQCCSPAAEGLREPAGELRSAAWGVGELPTLRRNVDRIM